MCGARMRSNSLAGTRPENTSRSVPRLSAPCRARTRTWPARGAPTRSRRISAFPGATYQSACAVSSATEFRSRSGAILVGLRPGPSLSPGPPRKNRRGGMPQSSLATVAAETGISVFARRLLFAALVAATTLGVLTLAVIALAPGGYGLVDLLLLLLYAI